MVPCYFVPLSASERWPDYDVHARPVVPLHVEVAGDEIEWLPVIEVPRDRERLEEHLGHDHRASEVEYDASAMEGGKRAGKPAEVAMTRVADGRPARRGMLMNDLRPERCVYGERNSIAVSCEQQRHFGVRELRLIRESTGQRLSHSPSLLHTTHKRFVHLTSGFLSHPERAIGKSSCNIFGRPAEPGDLVVVNHR